MSPIKNIVNGVVVSVMYLDFTFWIPFAIIMGPRNTEIGPTFSKRNIGH